MISSCQLLAEPIYSRLQAATRNVHLHIAAVELLLDPCPDTTHIMSEAANLTAQVGNCSLRTRHTVLASRRSAATEM